MTTDKSVYIVEMLLNHKFSAHRYILGCFSDLSLAEKAAEIEKAWRGTGYSYRIVPEIIQDSLKGKYWKDKIQWFEENN